MDTIKGLSLYRYLYDNNEEFKKVIDKGFASKQIRFFGEEEFKKMQSQNYIPPIPESSDTPNILADVHDLKDMFVLGHNIGDCKGMSYQLSYSYNNVDIVTGILPILKGTKNAPLEGGHIWLETKDEIIDTSLMLVINISMKDEIGYQEQYRITAAQLKSSPYYQKSKEWANEDFSQKQLR